MDRYSDRNEAGRKLAEALAARGYADPVVLALPRGGVPVALQVARALSAPLDLVMVRKIGVPTQPELAAAAVVNGPAREIVVNDEIAAMAGLDRAAIEALAETQLEEIRRRRTIYLKDRAPVELAGRTAIVVDDGLATGATMRAALIAVRRRKPARLVMAVPVAPEDTLARLAGEVDEVVCPLTPRHFYAIGAHYADFAQVPDSEVVRLMDEAAGEPDAQT
jgi:putative phosphoribosyl transferase